MLLIHCAVHWLIANATRSLASAIERANTHLGCSFGRRRTCDHGTVLNGGRRCGYMRSDIYRAERAVLRRLDPDRVGHLRASQRSCREARGSAVDGLAVHERIAICHGYGIHVVSVHKIDVANVGVENIRVADECVVHVDDGDEIPAATEPREERLAKSQREPSDPEAKAATEETDESRAVDRRPKKRARAPAPPAGEIVPTAVMVRRKAPRGIVNPGPSPRSNPVPIAIAVRSPAGRYFAGIPDVAVFGLIAPITVIIQIAVARRVARNVPSGNGIVFFQVAFRSPAVKAVGTRSLVNAVLNVVRAVEFRALAGVNLIGLAAGGNLAFAANHGHARAVTVFINVNAKSACFLDGESQIRSVYFVEIALTQFADTEVQTPLRKAHLRDALVEVQEGHRGHAAEMHRGGAGLQFGAGIFVNPDLVANGHRAVFCGAAPIPLSPGLQGDRTIHVADARDARRRIFFFIRSRLWRGKTQETGKTQ